MSWAEVDFSAVRQVLRIVKNDICICQFPVIEMSKKKKFESKASFLLLRYLFFIDLSFFL